MIFHILGLDDPALEALSEYIKTHPGANLHLTIVPWDNYQNTLNDALNQSQSPFQAVFIPGHVWLSTLVEEKKVAPLPVQRVSSELLSQFNLDDVFPKVRSECFYEEEWFLIPFFTDGHILFYLKDKIHLEVETEEEIPFISPKNLEQLVASVHHPPSLYGLALKASPSEIFLDWLPFLWDFGGDVLDNESKPIIYSDASVSALEVYCNLRQFCPPETHRFGNNEIAAVLRASLVCIAPTWGGQAAPIYAEGAAMRYSTALYSTPWNATWGIGIPANQPASLITQTTEHLLSIAWQAIDQKVLELAGSPVRNSTYTETNFKRYAWLKTQMKMLQRCSTLPSTPKLGKILGVLYPAIYSAFIGEVSPRKALSGAQLALEQII
jgi:multiple sugar transport system substrate-binding protein